MTVSDADFVSLWPRVRDSRCTVCGYRGTCTWSTAPTRLLCDECRSCLGFDGEERSSWG